MLIEVGAYNVLYSRPFFPKQRRVKVNFRRGNYGLSFGYSPFTIELEHSTIDWDWGKMLEWDSFDPTPRPLPKENKC